MDNEKRFNCLTHGTQDESVHYNSEYECIDITYDDESESESDTIIEPSN
jgi:hypothetical protein